MTGTKLHDGEDRHRKLLEGLFPCIEVTGWAMGDRDHAGHVVTASPTAIGILGALTADELRERPLSEFFSPIEDLVLLFEQAALEGTASSRGLLLTTRQGEAVAIQAMASASGRPGETILAFSLKEGAEQLRSRLHTSDNRFRKFFDEIPTSLWRVDGRFTFELFKTLRQQGITDIGAYFDEHPEMIERAMDEVSIVEVNAQTLAKFGGSEGGDIRRPVRYFMQGSQETFRRILEAKFNGLGDHVEETRVRTLDGRELHVLFTMTFPPAVEPDSFTLLSMIDVTDRVRAETELQRLQSQFAHSSRLSLLGELTASIAHEINQPLSAVATNGDAALRWLNRGEPNVAQAISRVVRITEDARRAGDVVQRLRALAQPQLARHVPMSVNESALEAVSLVRHEAAGKRVRIAHRLRSGLPPVMGDPIQIQQIVANLLINAIQAIAGDTAASDRRIDLATGVVGDVVELTVEDSGPGIGPNALPHVFEGFFTTKSDGMGMGLAISRTIAIAHRGELAATNSNGGGAAFTLRLPCLRD